MNRKLAGILTFAALTLSATALAADPYADLNQYTQTGKFVFKEGWSVIPVPILAYSNDLGLQLGAAAQLTDYGRNPSYYPEARQRINIGVSYFTKNQIFASADYSGDNIIPGIRLTAMASYSLEPLQKFYGFNGFVQDYDAWMDLNRKEGIAFYSLRSQTVRAQIAFSGKIVAGLGWFAGLDYRYTKTGNLTSKDYDSATLYREYVKEGIIRSEESGGGNTLELKTGFTYDSRDNVISPTKGIYGEILLAGGYCFDAGKNLFLRGAAHLRHYITPMRKKDWLTISYHLAYQGTLAGTAPFWLLPCLYSTDALAAGFPEGLGGDGSVRGIIRRRMVADAYAWGNFELRFRIWKWKVYGGFIGLGANPFCDVGAIVRPYRLQEQAAYLGEDAAALRKTACAPQVSVGAGINLNISNKSLISLSAARCVTSAGAEVPVAIYLTAGYIF